MALHNATIIDGVPYIATDKLILRSAAEESSPAIEESPRFAVVNEQGRFSALERDVMGFTSDGIMLLFMITLFIVCVCAHY